MKIKLNHFLGLILPLFFMVSCSSPQKIENKEIMYTYWQNRNGEFENLRFLPFFNYKEVYNKNGQLIEKVNYMSDTIFGTTKYIYQDGIKTEQLSFDKKNKLIHKTEYEYNQSSQLIGEIIDDLKSDKRLYKTYQYDSDGALIKKELQNSDHKTNEYWVYSYKFENGNKIETQEFYRGDTLAQVSETTYNLYGWKIANKESNKGLAIAYILNPKDTSDWIIQRFYKDSLVDHEVRKEYL